MPVELLFVEFVLLPLSVDVFGVVVVPGVVVPGAVAPSGVVVVACPGQLFFGTVPSAKYSVSLLHASLVASSPVSVHIVLCTIESGILNATDLNLFASCIRCMIFFQIVLW